MHCRFYYKFINYRVEERTGKTPVHIYLQPKPFSSEKGEEKKILVKNTSEHLKEEFRTIISITSEDNQV